MSGLLETLLDTTQKELEDERIRRRAAETVTRLRKIEMCRERAKRCREECESSSAHLRIAGLELLMAKRENETGETQVPVEATAAARFFEEQDAKKEN